MADRDAIVVLDPTLMLGESEWKKVEKKTLYCPRNKYVFVYALGNKTDRFKRKIEQLSKTYKILDVFAGGKKGKEMPIGPSEFLYLIRNAEIILTDSFHATVFSILYHKKFITFNRAGLNMNSRIESLAELVNQGEHLNELGDFDCESGIDYRIVDEILKEERKKSCAFLKNALEN